MSIGSLSLFRSQSGGERRASAKLATAADPRPQTTKRSTEEDERSSDDRSSTGSGPQKINMVRPPKEVADVELLQRFQQGDEEGYVELYLRRQAEVYTYCLRLAAGDRDFASDIFQETFIKVYRKANTFREGTNVLGWLYTIVRTTYLNHKRKRSLVGLDDSHEELQSTDRSMHPEFREEQSTLKERVERAIANLPIEIREPFILREFDGFSYQEISEQLNITLGAVRQRIYRAKLAMREELQDLVDDPSDDRSSDATSNILAEEDAG